MKDKAPYGDNDEDGDDRRPVIQKFLHRNFSYSDLLLPLWWFRKREHGRLKRESALVLLIVLLAVLILFVALFAVVLLFFFLDFLDLLHRLHERVRLSRRGILRDHL